MLIVSLFGFNSFLFLSSSWTKEELLFPLIAFERVLQIVVLNKLNKCTHTHTFPPYNLETLTALSAAQTVNCNTKSSLLF